MRRLSPRTRTRYLVSPFFRRVLFVVAAAMRSATLFERPRADSLRLMCSYWRLRLALFTPRGGIGRPPRKSYLFARMTGKFRTTGRLIGRLLSVRARLVAVLLLSVAACGPATVTSDAPSSSPLALPTASPDPSPIPTAAPTPTPLVATPEPAPRVTREIAGIEFALARGAADLRVEAALSRDDEAAAAATVAADVPAVESEL